MTGFLREDRRNAVEILHMELAAKLVPAAIIGFILLCMVVFTSHNFSLDLAIVLVWLLLASVAAGVWLIERHAARVLPSRR